jgi:uncharacterized protein YjbJ (UPF0337 family)
MAEKDRVEGTMQNVAGRAQEAVGSVTGNAGTRTEGIARQAAGTIQSTYGKAAESAKAAVAELGDRLGEQPVWVFLVGCLLTGGVGFVLGRVTCPHR